MILKKAKNKYWRNIQRLQKGYFSFERKIPIVYTAGRKKGIGLCQYWQTTLLHPLRVVEGGILETH